MPTAILQEMIDLLLTISEEYGVDLTDTRDNFFNDICVPFSQDNTDIPIIDRRKDFYLPPTFCDEGCYDGVFDFENKLVTCNCAPIAVEPEPSPFTLPISSSNLQIMTCFAHWIKWEKLRSSVGFWFGVDSVLLHLVFFGIFHYKGLKPLHGHINEIRLKKTNTNKKHKNAKNNDISTSSNEVINVNNNNKINEQNLESNEKDNKNESKNDQNVTVNLNSSKNIVINSIDRSAHFQTDVVPYSLALRTDNRRLQDFFLETI